MSSAIFIFFCNIDFKYLQQFQAKCYDVVRRPATYFTWYGCHFVNL